MPAPRELRVERLCVHHPLAAFSSGVTQVDATARQLQERVRQRDDGEFAAFVVVRGEEDMIGDVLAIAAVTDVLLEEDHDDAGGVVSGLCVFYSLLAVDERMRRDLAVLSRLLDELERIKVSKYSLGENYIGEIAAPLDDSPKSLRTFLRNHGFRQLKTDQQFWYRPGSN